MFPPPAVTMSSHFTSSSRDFVRAIEPPENGVARYIISDMYTQLTTGDKTISDKNIKEFYKMDSDLIAAALKLNLNISNPENLKLIADNVKKYIGVVNYFMLQNSKFTCQPYRKMLSLAVSGMDSMNDLLCLLSGKYDLFNKEYLNLLQTILQKDTSRSVLISTLQGVFNSKYFDKNNANHAEMAIGIFQEMNARNITSPQEDLVDLIKNLLGLKGKPYGFFLRSSKVELSNDNPLFKNRTFVNLAFETLRNIAGYTKNQFMVDFYLNACAAVNAQDNNSPTTSKM